MYRGIEYFYKNTRGEKIVKILEVKLKGIKKFFDEQEYLFDKADFINTVSGKNGSGKSTIFESVLLCQKAYFVQLILKESQNNKYKGIDVNSLMLEVGAELQKITVNKEALIEIKVGFNEEDFEECQNRGKYKPNSNNGKSYNVLISTKIFDYGKNWEVEVDEGKNNGILKEFWNITNPSQIIVYLDADKNVYEEDFTFQKISMLSNETINPIVQFTLQSKSLYQNMYDVMMNAYVYQRLNPQTPKKDRFVSDSKEMYHELISNVEISNFSGKEKKDQFVLISKNGEKYDARNLSSGEKLIWYILLVMNYVKKIGVLIIDEPENHLHEQLAWKFVDFLRTVIKEKKNLFIDQVFLITHSKNLIYNNFSSGKNYVINNKGELLLIDKENCEDILRACGISYIDDRVLFVEGKTESENLVNLCGMNNVRIRELTNCAEIIQVYESLVKVKELVYAPKFVFVIDRDTKDEKEISEIRNKDPEFFDKHFVVLPVHEFENFMLDEKVITQVVNSFLTLTKDSLWEEKQILSIMKKYADSSLDDTKKKYLNNCIREEIKKFASLVKQNDINIENQNKFNGYIDKLMCGDNYNAIINGIKLNYDNMMKQYGVLNWESNWKKICDGKRVYNQTVTEIASSIGIAKKKLNQMIFDELMDFTEGDLYMFWKGVQQKLD